MHGYEFAKNRVIVRCCFAIQHATERTHVYNFQTALDPIILRRTG
jgi:hypothetical protein